MGRTITLSLSALCGLLSAALADVPPLEFSASAPSVDAEGARVELRADGTGGTVVAVTCDRPLSAVALSWDFPLGEGARVLGDHWERTYSDAAWRKPSACGPLPWYFLVADGGRTDGFGVRVQPNAFASWTVDGRRLRLVLDVRACGRPVELRGRTLEAATLVSRRGERGESAYDAGRAFCRTMCPRPRLPKEPVYGFNDWYCAYGKQTAEGFLRDAAAVVALCDGLENRPYAVVDDGWQRDMVTGKDWGDWGWTRSSPHFGMSMEAFAEKVAALGAKPGLWYRPLVAWPGADASLLMPGRPEAFDPTLPAVRRRIVEDMRRFRGWGMKLVKVDFLTNDWSLNWSMAGEGEARRPMASPVAHDLGWRDSSRTTVEVMKDVYSAIREGAGDGVAVIGCNALNHLAAGLFELQRIGDDTSGREWVRTRDMGVNAVAFRSIQDGTFFSADPDCVGLAEAGAVPWRLNAQWLDLVSRSGMPLFVSWKRDLLDGASSAALKAAFARASRTQRTIEPLDWAATRFPRRWRAASGDVSYDWDGSSRAD